MSVTSLHVKGKVVRTPDNIHHTFFFASKTLFDFIMFMKHADGCSEYKKIPDELSRTVFIHF